MSEITAVDSYGRRTKFKGELLVSDTTDNGEKPRWLDIDIWRTEGGSYVVKRSTHYGVVHTSTNCRRLEGYSTREVAEDDTHPCSVCNRVGDLTRGWGQESRVTVDVYRTPGELIESMKFKGEYTRLSHSLLAQLSEKDGLVDALWNTVRVD